MQAPKLLPLTAAPVLIRAERGVRLAACAVETLVRQMCTSVRNPSAVQELQKLRWKTPKEGLFRRV